MSKEKRFKKGERIRQAHRFGSVPYFFYLVLPFYLLIGFLLYQFVYPLILENKIDQKTLIIYGVALALCSVAFMLIVGFWIHHSKTSGGFFTKIYEKKILANVLIEHGFYREKISNQSSKNRTKRRKIKLAKTYYQRKGSLLTISFALDGAKYQNQLLKLDSFFETTFSADVVEKVERKGMISFTFQTEVAKQRIKINEMKTKKDRVQLMKGYWWNFEKDPHLLIGGGTGGGKTFTILSLVLALLNIGEVEICDPKNSDLMDLDGTTVFEGKIYTGKAIIGCLRRANAEMLKRYKYMKEHPNRKMGENYRYYGLKPKFIVVDEWAAFMAEARNMEDGYKIEKEIDNYLTQLVLKARQAGIFMIVAMQRPDGEYIKTALRDNFMFRMSVGTLSSSGYTMIFGEAADEKIFKVRNLPGTGYVGKGGDSCREFLSPFVTKEFDFFEAFSKFDKQESTDFSNIIVTKKEAEELLTEIGKKKI